MQDFAAALQVMIVVISEPSTRSGTAAVVPLCQSHHVRSGMALGMCHALIGCCSCCHMHGACMCTAMSGLAAVPCALCISAAGRGSCTACLQCNCTAALLTVGCSHSYTSYTSCARACYAALRCYSVIAGLQGNAEDSSRARGSVHA